MPAVPDPVGDALALARTLISCSSVREEMVTDSPVLLITQSSFTIVFALLSATVTFNVPPAAVDPPLTAALAAIRYRLFRCCDVMLTSPFAVIVTSFPTLEIASFLRTIALKFPPSAEPTAEAVTAAAAVMTRAFMSELLRCVYFPSVAVIFV